MIANAIRQTAILRTLYILKVFYHTTDLMAAYIVNTIAN